MTFTQRIIDNPEGDDVLIVGELDGVEVWRSWASSHVDPAVRLNIDHPRAVDDRTTTPPGEVKYRVPTETEADELGMAGDLHRVAATYATVTGVVTVDEAAKATGLPAKALVDEALGWAAAAAQKK